MTLCRVDRAALHGHARGQAHPPAQGWRIETMAAPHAQFVRAVNPPEPARQTLVWHTGSHVKAHVNET